MSDVTVSIYDLKAVATALRSDHWSTTDERSRAGWTTCLYCDGGLTGTDWSPDVDKFPHDPECPVVIAGDLLTGL